MHAKHLVLGDTQLVVVKSELPSCVAQSMILTSLCLGSCVHEVELIIDCVIWLS